MRRPECPEGFVVACVDGVLVSVGVARICEEACDGECCVSLGMCDGFTVVWLSRDSTSCPGEGAYGDASIDDVFWGARALRRATTPQGRGWAIGEVIQGCFGERVCAQATDYGGEIPKESWMVPQQRGVRLGHVRRKEHQLHQWVLRGGWRVLLGRVRGEHHGVDGGLVHRVRLVPRRGTQLRRRGGLDRIMPARGEGVWVRQDGQFRLHAGGDGTRGPRGRR